MSDSVWQTIRAAIDARLKTILTTGGYQTNAGQNVFYWRTTSFIQNEDGTFPEFPGIKYYELTEKTETMDFPVRSNVATLNIECMMAGSDDIVVKQVIDQIYSDVMKAIGTDETWGGKAIVTEKVAHEVKMERGELLFGAIIITFEITYRNLRWDLTTAM